MVLKLSDNQAGYTLFELLIAMAIVVLISTLVVIQIQVRDEEKVVMATEQLATDLRRIRNLATSRVVDSSGQYPADGYGIRFTYNVSLPYLGYEIFSKDTVIEEVDLTGQGLYIQREGVSGLPVDTFSLQFKNEHEIITDIVSIDGNRYLLEIGSLNSDKKGTISIFDRAADGYAWGNINVTYEN